MNLHLKNAQAGSASWLELFEPRRLRDAGKRLRRRWGKRSPAKAWAEGAWSARRRRTEVPRPALLWPRTMQQQERGWWSSRRPCRRAPQPQGVRRSHCSSTTVLTCLVAVALAPERAARSAGPVPGRRRPRAPGGFAFTPATTTPCPDLALGRDEDAVRLNRGRSTVPSSYLGAGAPRGEARRRSTSTSSSRRRPTARRPGASRRRWPGAAPHMLNEIEQPCGPGAGRRHPGASACWPSRCDGRRGTAAGAGR